MYDSDALADRFVELAPRPDAVIATRDTVAAHLIQALINCGVKIPGEVTVTGFDNDRHVARLFRPLFPTSRPDFIRLGQVGVDVMDNSIRTRNGRMRTHYLSVPIQWRDAHPGVHAIHEMEGGEITVEA